MYILENLLLAYCACRCSVLQTWTHYLRVCLHCCPFCTHRESDVMLEICWKIETNQFRRRWYEMERSDKSMSYFTCMLFIRLRYYWICRQRSNYQNKTSWRRRSLRNGRLEPQRGRSQPAVDCLTSVGRPSKSPGISGSLHKSGVTSRSPGIVKKTPGIEGIWAENFICARNANLCRI